MGIALLFVYVLVGIFGLVAFQSQGGGVLHLKYLSIPAVFFFSWVGRIYVPAIFVIPSLEPEVAFRYALSVASVLLTVPIGMAAVNLVFGFSIREIRRFHDRRIVASGWKSWNSIALGVLLLGALSLTVYYLYYTPTVALFTLLSRAGSSLEIALAREASFKLLDGGILYAFAWLRNTVWPFLILLTFAMFYTRRSRGWLALFMLSLFAGSFYAALSTARGPLAMIAFDLVLILYLLRKGRFRLRTYGAALVGVFSLPVLFTALRSSGGWSLSLTRLIDVLYSVVIRRVFILPADVLASYFEVFPSVHPHLAGASLSIASLWGVVPFDVGNYVAMYRGGTIATATSNAAFIGSAWADFGWSGVLGFGLLLGVLLQMANLWVVRRRKTPTSYVLFVLFGAVAFGLVSRPLSSSLVTHGGLAAIMVFLAFRYGSIVLKGAADPPVQGDPTAD